MFRDSFETLFRFLDAVMTIKTKQPFNFETYLNGDDVLVVPQELSTYPEAFIPNYRGAIEICLKNHYRSLEFGKSQLRAIKKLIRDALQGFAKEHIVNKIVVPKLSSGFFSNINEADIQNLDEKEPMKIVQAVSNKEDYTSTNKFAEALYKLGKKLHEPQTASAA